MQKLQISLLVCLSILSISFGYDSKMSKSEILAKQGILVVMPPDFEYEFKFKVISYDWIFKTKNDIYAGTNIGSKYSKDLEKRIKEGNPNDLFIVENVRVIGDDKLVRKIEGLVVVLK